MVFVFIVTADSLHQYTAFQIATGKEFMGLVRSRGTRFQTWATTPNCHNISYGIKWKNKKQSLMNEISLFRVAVEDLVHLSHWLLMVKIISAQREASIFAVVHGWPPKT